MTKTIVFLMTLMFVLPFDGSAQAVPSPGDRIRIKQVDGTVLTGTLATFSAETIQLSVDSSRVEVPVARIEVLWTSLGQGHNYPKTIVMTLAATLTAGAIIGAIVYVDTNTRCSWLCIGPQTRHESMAWGLAGGAIIGLPLGVIIGSMVRMERWNRVALPAPTAPRLTIRPMIGSRVGFAGSLRVGGR